MEVRPALADDEPSFIGIVAAGFRDHFDRYLFQVELDYEADTARTVREILGGHYGEFLPWASTVAERDGRPVGVLLVVRAPNGPLIISVAVDPVEQRRGIGRALVVQSIRALRVHGEASPFLNVTEGNAGADRLYRSLGFVPTVTGWAWYSLDSVPVAPDGRPTISPTMP